MHTQLSSGVKGLNFGLTIHSMFPMSVCEQLRLWLDCADAQALSQSPLLYERSTKIARAGSIFFHKCFTKANVVKQTTVEMR